MEYTLAGNVMKKFLSKKGSVMSLIFTGKSKFHSKQNNSELSSKKKIYALVCKTIEKYSLLSELIDKVNLCGKTEIPTEILMVLLYDMLFGKGLKCGGKWKKELLPFRSQLRNELRNRKDEKKVVRRLDFPKYSRINILKITKNKIIRKLRDHNIILSDRQQTNRNSVHFTLDKDIDNLILFPSDFDISTLPNYIREGCLVLQDKASCLPVQVLHPAIGSEVIDACAAPGIKTSQLAAVMNNVGKIYAFDLNKSRLGTLNKMMTKYGCTCVTPLHQDFLTVVPDDFPDVKYILVDPSCSGIGMVKRIEQPIMEDENRYSERLKKLHAFQSRILNHAFKFPKANRIVYSTCSLHQEENELVVKEVLEGNRDKFDLIHAYPEWKHRGLSDQFALGERCIRASYESDRTNGFFVALFQRK